MATQNSQVTQDMRHTARDDILGLARGLTDSNPCMIVIMSTSLATAGDFWTISDRYFCWASCVNPSCLLSGKRMVYVLMLFSRMLWHTKSTVSWKCIAFIIIIMCRARGYIGN